MIRIINPYGWFLRFRKFIFNGASHDKLHPVIDNIKELYETNRIYSFTWIIKKISQLQTTQYGQLAEAYDYNFIQIANDLERHSIASDVAVQRLTIIFNGSLTMMNNIKAEGITLPGDLRGNYKELQKNWDLFICGYFKPLAKVIYKALDREDYPYIFNSLPDLNANTQ